MIRRYFLVLITIFMVTGLMAKDGGDKQLKVGDKMPSFTIVSDKGVKTSSSTFSNKVVLINFFATWCPPCQKKLAAVQKTLWPKFKNNKKFVLLTIGREHNESELKVYNEKKKFDFPLYPDKNRSIFSAFADNLIPRSFLIDKNGKIVYSSCGYTDEEFSKLMAEIEKQLKE